MCVSEGEQSPPSRPGVLPLGGFDQVLLVRPLVRDEQSAVRALEPLIAGRGARDQLGLEALAAMRAGHLEGLLGSGGLGH